MNQSVGAFNPEENAHFRECAVDGTEKTPIDLDLQAIIERWTTLTDAVKAG